MVYPRWAYYFKNILILYTAYKLLQIIVNIYKYIHAFTFSANTGNAEIMVCKCIYVYNVVLVYLDFKNYDSIH